jgi:hypothetical protein
MISSMTRITFGGQHPCARLAALVIDDLVKEGVDPAPAMRDR